MEPAPAINETASFKLKAHSHKQLSDLYEVSGKTFRRWLQPIATEIGPRQGRYYNIAQVESIVNHLDTPGNQLTE